MTKTSKVDDLRKVYENADAAAAKLSGEYQEKVDKQVTAKWQELKDRYGARIDEANAEAQEAQQRYLAYEAAAALLERGEEGESTLGNHSGEGGKRLQAAYDDLKGS
jgi:glutamyl-tRNA reductase